MSAAARMLAQRNRVIVPLIAVTGGRDAMTSASRAPRTDIIATRSQAAPP
jgi:delta 1-pyrroline-5-carboxylate dehydrogenase